MATKFSIPPEFWNLPEDKLAAERYRVYYETNKESLEKMNKKYRVAVVMVSGKSIVSKDLSQKVFDSVTNPKLFDYTTLIITDSDNRKQVINLANVERIEILGE